MEVFKSYLDTIENQKYREKLEGILSWIMEEYPEFKPEIKWNQPMFSYKGTFIIGFSIAKNHFSFSPEAYTLERFVEAIDRLGYDKTKGLVKIKWKDRVDYGLFSQLIDFNIKDKADCKTFFRC